MEDLPRPLPSRGAIFLDARGAGRAMRVSWHHEASLVVLSLWRDNVCSGSFRLAVDEVPALIELLRDGLDGLDGRDDREGFGGTDDAPTEIYG